MLWPRTELGEPTEKVTELPTAPRVPGAAAGSAGKKTRTKTERGSPFSRDGGGPAGCAGAPPGAAGLNPAPPAAGAEGRAPRAALGGRSRG